MKVTSFRLRTVIVNFYILINSIYLIIWRASIVIYNLLVAQISINKINFNITQSKKWYFNSNIYTKDTY